MFLGSDIRTNQEVGLDREARTRHALILGKTGTGKSNLMLNMMRQDMLSGHGFMLLDPFGNLTNDVLSHVPTGCEEDIVLFDLADTAYPFGLNLFEEGTPTEVVEVFQTAWDGPFSPLAKKWLTIITQALQANGGGTMLDASRFLHDQAFRERLMQNVRNEQAQLDVRSATVREGKLNHESISSTANRLGEYLREDAILAIVGQKQTTVPFRHLITQNKVVLWNFHDPSGTNALAVNLIGALVFQFFRRSTMMEPILPYGYSLYMDECHRFISPNIGAMLGGTRQFGVGMVMATQDLGKIQDRQTRDDVLGVNTLISFSVHPNDNRLLKPSFQDLTIERQEYNPKPRKPPKPPRPPKRVYTPGRAEKRVSDYVGAMIEHRVSDRRLTAVPDEDPLAFFLSPRWFQPGTDEKQSLIY